MRCGGEGCVVCVMQCGVCVGCVRGVMCGIGGAWGGGEGGGGAVFVVWCEGSMVKCDSMGCGMVRRDTELRAG